MTKKNMLLGFLAIGALVAGPALAQQAQKFQTATSTPKPTVDLQCVSKAVAARESAVASAYGTYSQAMQAAMGTRSASLAQAYSQQGGNDTIKKAIKAAWDSYRTSSKESGKAWKTARDSSWKDFRAAVKLCKVPGSVTDTGYSAREASGQ